MSALLALGTACAAVPVAPPAEELSLALSPASLGRSLSLAQRITVVAGPERRSFDALLEVDEHALQLGLIVAGHTVGTLRWDGTRLDGRAPPELPQAVTPGRVLTDVQLTWWPVAAVESALRGRFEVREAGATRVVTRDGVPVATVTWEGEGPNWRHVVVEHHGRYRLEVDSLENPP